MATCWPSAPAHRPNRHLFLWLAKPLANSTWFRWFHEGQSIQAIPGLWSIQHRRPWRPKHSCSASAKDLQEFVSFKFETSWNYQVRWSGKALYKHQIFIVTISRLIPSSPIGDFHQPRAEVEFSPALARRLNALFQGLEITLFQCFTSPRSVWT